MAITDQTGTVTDTFRYDTYGKLLSRTGSTDLIFGYNGRDGVVTDTNGLIYMRARYYSPELRRFVNADIIPGEISQAVTLNRYAYANGNPVSNVDPFGLAAEDKGGTLNNSIIVTADWAKMINEYYVGTTTFSAVANNDVLAAFYADMYSSVQNGPRPKNIGKGLYAKQVETDLTWIDDMFGEASTLAATIEIVNTAGIVVDIFAGGCENYQNGVDGRRIASDALVDLGVNICSDIITTMLSTATTTKVAGSVAPGVGNLIGAGIGLVAGVGIYIVTEVVEFDGKLLLDWTKEGVDMVFDEIVDGIISLF